MVRGISPLVQRETERLEATRAGAAHIAGGFVGGAGAGLSTWMLLTPGRVFVVPEGIVLSMGLVVGYQVWRDIHVGSWQGRASQVPQSWFGAYGLIAAYWRYGLLLGAVYLTYVPFAGTFAVMAMTGLIGPIAALGTGAAFGIARTAMVLPAASAGLLRSAIERFYFRSIYGRRWCQRRLLRSERQEALELDLPVGIVDEELDCPSRRRHDRDAEQRVRARHRVVRPGPWRVEEVREPLVHQRLTLWVRLRLVPAQQQLGSDEPEAHPLVS